MIDRAAFLADAQKLVGRLEQDLRARCDERPEVGRAVEQEYRRARDAGRTGQTPEEWRADAVTQQAVAWVLSCVFVRFLEDNHLTEPARLAGPGERLGRARDEHEVFFRAHPEQTDRDYLLTLFDDLARRPATRDLFESHNPIRALPGWLSPDAAKDLLIPFFQRIDPATGALIHDFTDPALDTRFLGDLYQDLSEAARKRYALLQTPVFVEEFILDRTLTPAVETFGLAGVKLIDPACGSGHFLLGAFARLLELWTREQPGAPRREVVQRALAAVHGVDLNPYAVAIARFRLLLAAWRACGFTSLEGAPHFDLNLACGDSLLHGATRPVQGELPLAGMGHYYQPEDPELLERLLRPGTYQAVVANPPYITPKDRGLNEKYRERYSSCHGKYSLAVPFMQRIFDLACEDGFTGQITANSFMKREFGKKLIEEFFPTVDLTYVIDTSLAFIPGHGTPTVIILGQNRHPIGNTVRTVMGIKREDQEPVAPEKGKVWSAVLEQIEQVGSHSPFVSTADKFRAQFHKHPWSLGGGGASELKEIIEEKCARSLGAVADVGVAVVTAEDDAFLLPPSSVKRRRIPAKFMRAFVIGDSVRDWGLHDVPVALFPHSPQSLEAITVPEINRSLWALRARLASRLWFGKTQIERGLAWFGYGHISTAKLNSPSAIIGVLVATHNHFAWDSQGALSGQATPLVKLPGGKGADDYLALLACLNSSVAAFWTRQVCHDKGGGGIGGGIAAESWERFREYDSTKIRRLPLPETPSPELARQLDALARELAELIPARALERWAKSLTQRRKGAKEEKLGDLTALREAYDRTRRRMIALQEDLDWQCYHLYGLLDEPLCDFASLREMSLGQRAFEIVLARKVRDEGLQTSWFARHGSTPTTDTDDPLTLRRIAAIEANPQVALIEQPEYKRRWSDTPWEDKVRAACAGWLLDRLEGYFQEEEDLTQRRKGAKEDQEDDQSSESLGVFAALREVSLYSVSKITDVASRDAAFQEVATLYRGRPDFDTGKLVRELVEGESVPLLPVLRYKPSGLDKRRAWERTWDLQRREDAIDRRATLRGVAVNEGGWAAATDDGVSPLNPAQAAVLKAARVGAIPPPPKYKSADFQAASYWRLRGSLDVPKERWVSFPHCEGADGLPVVAWAGYDHLQLARAVAAYYVAVQEQEGGREDARLRPLLAGLVELLPWLKQWHNDPDPEFNMGLGDYFEGFVQEEARGLGLTLDEVRAWQPPAKAKRGRKAGG